MANVERKTPELPATQAEWTFDGLGLPTHVAVKFPRLGKELRLDLTALDPLIRGYLTAHGAEQKIRDAAALQTQTINGKTVRPTDAEKFDAAKEVFDRLVAGGPWNAPRGPGEGTMLFQAVQKALPGKFGTMEDLNVWIAEQADAQGSTKTAVRTWLENHKPVKVELERIKRERGATVDSGAMMSALDSIPPKA